MPLYQTHRNSLNPTLLRNPTVAQFNQKNMQTSNIKSNQDGSRQTVVETIPVWHRETSTFFCSKSLTGLDYFLKFRVVARSLREYDEIHLWRKQWTRAQMLRMFICLKQFL